MLVARLVVAVLGVVHRHVRISEQSLRRRTLVSLGQPCRSPDVRHPCGEQERIRELSLDACCERSGVGGIDLLGDDHELVAAVACDDVADTQRRFDATRRNDQQVVARLMPETVVDRLEAIEIEEDHRQELGRAVMACERAGEVVDDRAPVRETRQRVRGRQTAQLGLGSADLGDVMEREHSAGAIASIGDGRRLARRWRT